MTGPIPASSHLLFQEETVLANLTELLEAAPDDPPPPIEVKALYDTNTEISGARLHVKNLPEGWYKEEVLTALREDGSLTGDEAARLKITACAARPNLIMFNLMSRQEIYPRDIATEMASIAQDARIKWEEAVKASCGWNLDASDDARTEAELALNGFFFHLAKAAMRQGGALAKQLQALATVHHGLADLKKTAANDAGNARQDLNRLSAELAGVSRLQIAEKILDALHNNYRVIDNSGLQLLEEGLRSSVTRTRPVWRKYFGFIAGGWEGRLWSGDAAPLKARLAQLKVAQTERAEAEIELMRVTKPKSCFVLSVSEAASDAFMEAHRKWRAGLEALGAAMTDWRSTNIAEGSRQDDDFSRVADVLSTLEASCQGGFAFRAFIEVRARRAVLENEWSPEQRQAVVDAIAKLHHMFMKPLAQCIEEANESAEAAKEAERAKTAEANRRGLVGLVDIFRKPKV